MNFKPRYLVQTIKEDGTRVFAGFADDSASAETLEAHLLGLGMSVVVTDHGLLERASTSAGARARGYYGMRYSGKDILSFVQGKIDRAADEALDSLDDLVEQMEVGA